MMKNYYSDAERKCPCGCGTDVDPETLDKFNLLREEYGKPIYIEQMATCIPYSNTIGRKSTSSHNDGRAGDVKSKTFKTKEDYFNLVAIAIRIGFTGFGQGSYWLGSGSDKRLHLDTKRSANGDFRSWVY